MLALDLSGGFHPGPLFIINKRRPAKKELHKTGWARRQDEYKAAPPWSDKAAVREIYKQCKRLNQRDGPRTWAVDHIYPLNHPLVCGMHIAINLQIVPYEENAKKSNIVEDIDHMQQVLF